MRGFLSAASAVRIFLTAVMVTFHRFFGGPVPPVVLRPYFEHDIVLARVLDHL
jgi:hypothetical protein